MTLKLEPELQRALELEAQRQGMTPEDLALSLLRSRFQSGDEELMPRDDWERRVLSMGIPCGTSLSNEALSSEGLYD